MKTKAVFFHAGCPVCLNAEQSVARVGGRNRFELEIVHLGDDKSRLAEAEGAGEIRSRPRV